MNSTPSAQPDEYDPKPIGGRDFVLAFLFPIAAPFLAIPQLTRNRVGPALAVLLVAALGAGSYYLIAHAVTSGGQDRNVAGDLRTLLNSHHVQYDRVSGCVHQTGNQYVCTVAQGGEQVPVQVTDDGKSIYEQGVQAP